jgi:hypothetical protein
MDIAERYGIRPAEAWLRSQPHCRQLPRASRSGMELGRWSWPCAASASRPGPAGNELVQIANGERRKRPGNLYVGHAVPEGHGRASHGCAVSVQRSGPCAERSAANQVARCQETAFQIGRGDDVASSCLPVQPTHAARRPPPGGRAFRVGSVPIGHKKLPW